MHLRCFSQTNLYNTLPTKILRYKLILIYVTTCFYIFIKHKGSQLDPLSRNKSQQTLQHIAFLS